MSLARITYDCEFLERPGKIDPISIGMVDLDTGEEFYAVYDDFDTRAVAADWWLMKNVMGSISYNQFVVADFEGAPLLKDIHPVGPDVKSRREIQEGILNLVGDRDEVEFWAWYGCYDHVVLGQTFGRMTNFPPHFPYFTEDIKSLHKRKGTPGMPEQPLGKHNALEDARWNVVRYQFLIGLPDA